MNKERKLFFKKINRIINIKKASESNAKGLDLVCELKEKPLYSGKMYENVTKLINERIVPVLKKYQYNSKFIGKLSFYGLETSNARILLDEVCYNKNTVVNKNEFIKSLSIFFKGEGVDIKAVETHLSEIQNEIKLSLDAAAKKYRILLGDKADRLSPFTEKQILSLFDSFFKLENLYSVKQQTTSNTTEQTTQATGSTAEQATSGAVIEPTTSEKEEIYVLEIDDRIGGDSFRV